MLGAGGDAMLGVLGYNQHLPLHFAALKSTFPAVIELLLARGPAGSAPAEIKFGDTPLHYADTRRHEAVEEIQVLLRAAVR
jgi:ankyrin repeat protein